MSEHEEHLSNRDYKRLCGLIQDVTGIHLGGEKMTMLESRVRRRLRALDLRSYEAYCDKLFHEGVTHEEVVLLIDAVTTNKTDFFREPAHFDFLTERGLPEMADRCRGTRPLIFWSAGCSSGEEPYTLAMLLSEFLEKRPDIRFKIMATDISTAMLRKAVTGVYPADNVEPVPMCLRKKYLMRSRDRESQEVRIVPELRRLVEFRRLNFMEDQYGVGEKTDAIFCRNVLIYFDRSTQQQILRKLIRHLRPHGYLFVGHSESLHDMNLPVKPVAPALYQRISDGS